MAHYLQTAEEFGAIVAVGVWSVENTGARRIDVGDNTPLGNASGADMVALLHATYPGSKFHRLTLEPGQYYPRMARPNNSHPQQSPGSNPGNRNLGDLIETGRGQLMALRAQLERIFRVVHPVEQNYNAFGHDIRNLLILAATEVETHCKGVLTTNGARADTMHDYVKLAAAMRLGDFAVRLPFYPWLKPVTPFLGWKPSKSPSKDLPWYDAYNKAKHDRENAFSCATLLHAIQAVCGCAVMSFAQFGVHAFHHRVEINSFFELSRIPAWAPSEVYCDPFGAGYMPVNYPFTA
jgi:hypothetical protein